MDSIKSKVRKTLTVINNKLVDDSFRYRFQLTIVYWLMGTVAGVMSVINLVMHNYLLLWVTLIFTVSCIINLYYITRTKSSIIVSSAFFFIAVSLMLIYFIISGNPEGFSILWVCLLPSCGMMLLGRKKASIYTLIMFVILIFFLWTPIGSNLLMYDYTSTFKLRFPFLLVAIYITSFFLETIRHITHREMIKAKSDYEYLYIHDALTGVYNRYGFNLIIDDCLDTRKTSRSMFFMIIDLDDFKDINDTYGHLSGDKVLISIAECIQKAIGDCAHLCRWGGEEFAIIMMDNLSIEEAKIRAEKVRRRIEELTVESEGSTINITASIGAVLKNNRKEVEISSLVKTADSYLYKAKEEGKNRVLFGEI